jgi:hypothetical protein
MSEVKIVIRKLAADADACVVGCTLSNGYELRPQPCSNENDARVYIAGLTDGMNAVKNLIGHVVFRNEIIEA